MLFIIFSDLRLINKISATRINNSAEIGQLYLIPVDNLNHSAKYPLLTVQEEIFLLPHTEYPEIQTG